MPFYRIKLASTAILASIFIAHPAFASTIILGDSKAADCSKAAINARFTPLSERLCDEALSDSNISNIDLAATYVNRGIIRLRLGKTETALNDFEYAIQLSPNLGEAYANRGAAAILQSRFNDGIADIDHGLNLGLDDPAKAYFNRAIAHEALDNINKAYFDFKRANELKPEWGEPKTQLTRFTIARK